MRKLSGAKDKLALRVHALIVGSPEKKRADPAVLRALCSNPLPSGRMETLITEFAGWASVSCPAVDRLLELQLLVLMAHEVCRLTSGRWPSRQERGLRWQWLTELAA